MFRIICLLIGYGFGMIQTSYIIGKMSGIDIREHGSKNAGFTNTNRVLGIKKGAIVFVVDVAKAMLAFAFATFVYNGMFAREFAWGFGCLEGADCLYYGVVDAFRIIPRVCSPMRSTAYAGGTFFASRYIIPGLWAGLGAILGHCFPFYLDFKGGKGVACVLGVIIMLDWRIMVFSFAIGLFVVATTRFISLASLLITLSVPILLFVFRYLRFIIDPIDGVGFWILRHAEEIWITAAICIIIWYLHRENIKRLWAGTENQFSFKRKSA